VIIFSTYRLKRDHDKADYHYRAAKQACAYVMSDRRPAANERPRLFRGWPPSLAVLSRRSFSEDGSLPRRRLNQNPHSADVTLSCRAVAPAKAETIQRFNAPPGIAAL